jgi:hypothetical protein
MFSAPGILVTIVGLLSPAVPRQTSTPGFANGMCTDEPNGLTSSLVAAKQHGYLPRLLPS